MAGVWLVRLVWVCWVCSGYLVGFILRFWFWWDFVGPRVVVAQWDRRFERVVVVVFVGAWW